MKTCTKCKIEKEVTQFSPKKSWCKACINYDGTNHDNGLRNKYFSMVLRCRNKKQKYAKYYALKGIKNEWKSYREFKADMYESYLKHLAIHGRWNTQIDRIDNDGNYSKKNCRWLTGRENCIRQGKLANSSNKYKGVTSVKKSGLWRMQIKKDGKVACYKLFKTELEAVKAYNKLVREIHGELAYINKI